MAPAGEDETQINKKRKLPRSLPGPSCRLQDGGGGGGEERGGGGLVGWWGFFLFWHEERNTSKTLIVSGDNGAGVG